VALCKMPRLRGALISLIVSPREASPSPSNVWLSKLSADLVVSHESVTMTLPGLVLKVGPRGLSVILVLLDPACE
jgi:hypothetical protein